MPNTFVQRQRLTLVFDKHQQEILSTNSSLGFMSIWIGYPQSTCALWLKNGSNSLGAGGQKKVLKCNNVQPHFHHSQQMCNDTAISFPKLYGSVMCIALYRVLTRPETTTFTQKAKCGMMKQTENRIKMLMLSYICLIYSCTVVAGAIQHKQKIIGWQNVI